MLKLLIYFTERNWWGQMIMNVVSATVPYCTVLFKYFQQSGRVKQGAFSPGRLCDTRLVNLSTTLDNQNFGEVGVGGARTSVSGLRVHFRG